MPHKQNVVLYLDKEVVAKSRGLGFNLSRTYENHLKQMISKLSSGKDSCWWAGPDLDQRPSARQADVLPS
jgi:post-segregation antitoxin (ccd killing protein)